jgi:hypothetical protein
MVDERGRLRILDYLRWNELSQLVLEYIWARPKPFQVVGKAAFSLRTQRAACIYHSQHSIFAHQYFPISVTIVHCDRLANAANTHCQ